MLPVASALVLVLYTSNGHQRLVGSPSCQRVGSFSGSGLAALVWATAQVYFLWVVVRMTTWPTV